MPKIRWADFARFACLGCAIFGLLALPSPAAAKKRTARFNRCVSTAIGIPDGPPDGTTVVNPAASFAIPVRVPGFKGRPQNGVIKSFDSAGVRISHTDDGDLALFLVSPGGRAVALSIFRDQSTNLSPSGDGYGTGPPNCTGSLVRFGDGFGTSIGTPGNTSLDAPINGFFRPEQPLSAFVGGPARGLWTLIVQDVQFQDVGQIDALSLSFTYRFKVRKRR